VGLRTYQHPCTGTAFVGAGETFVNTFVFNPGYLFGHVYAVYLQTAMASSSLVSSVLSTHKPESWSYMTADTEVELVELAEDNQEFVSVKNKIKRTLSFDVNRVQRVQNPYIYGKYEVSSNEQPCNRWC
jgi:sugar/nucleoside kinase (ribokinase family)